MNVETIAVHIAAPPERVHAFASNPENLPRWVPSFFESIERVDATWVARTPLGRVVVAFVPDNGPGVLDHTLTLPSGERITNSMRVIASGEGSEVLFTLIQRAGTSDAAFRQDAALGAGRSSNAEAAARGDARVAWPRRAGRHAWRCEETKTREPMSKQDAVAAMRSAAAVMQCAARRSA
ncbi:SRPBCC family protein [Thiobacillus denitrificans]|nr:SRPBCC family protein [Thiobacillus denitrificans]